VVYKILDRIEDKDFGEYKIHTCHKTLTQVLMFITSATTMEFGLVHIFIGLTNFLRFKFDFNK